MKEKKTAIWAIDPFETETRPDRGLVSWLMTWAKASNLELQPVFVLSLPNDESRAVTERLGITRYLSIAEKASEYYLRELGATGFLPVKVVPAESASLKI